jgi:uncharacterized heparinase superfamily protein
VEQLFLYVRTARHLKLSQVLARLWMKTYRPRPDLRSPPSVRMPIAQWQPSPSKAPTLVSSKRARILNVEHDIWHASAWNDATREKLWLYNLHYFDDLARADQELWRGDHHALLRRWVAENPPGAGIGWEPYPLSLRIVNWIKWHLRTRRLDDVLLQSLAVQTRYLSRRLERHLLGNHLLANAKALAFSGMFFEGDEGLAWRALAMRLLNEQLQEQVLADGGHFELSPMYHGIVLGDALDLLNAGTAFANGVEPAHAEVLARWRAAVPRMLAWLAAMTHADGEISFFNDAAPGIASRLDVLTEYASSLGIAAPPKPRSGITQLSASGYARLERDPAVMIVDVGRVGPDYNPGHAHADTLSFELAVFGQRLVVNSGTSRYGLGPERDEERATAAHSTVVVDGQNSSEVWSGFRVGRRARPIDLAIADEGSWLRVSCAHDGYRRLAGSPTHHRTWLLKTGGLQVEDHVRGTFRSAVARFHLHPAVTITFTNGHQGTFRLASGREVQWQVLGGKARIEASFYCPEFGRRVGSQCLAVKFEDASCRTQLNW